MLENVPWQSSLPLLWGGDRRIYIYIYIQVIIAAVLGQPIKFPVKMAEGRRPG